MKSVKQITTQKLILLEQSEPVQTNYKGNKTANMIVPRLEKNAGDHHYAKSLHRHTIFSQQSTCSDVNSNYKLDID